MITASLLTTFGKLTKVLSFTTWPLAFYFDPLIGGTINTPDRKTVSITALENANFVLFGLLI